MDPKNTVTTASSDLCPCPFLTKTINGASSLKQKSIRNTFNKYDDDDTGLITCSEGEEVMYDILNIFKIHSKDTKTPLGMQSKSRWQHVSPNINA